MLADYFIFAVFQLSVRTLESPGELAVGAGLAGIDLRSLRMHEQYGIEPSGDGNCVGYVGRRFLGWRFVLLGRLRVRKDTQWNEHQTEDRDNCPQDSLHVETLATLLALQNSISISQRLSRLQRVLNSFLRLLLAAERFEALALQIEDVLL